VLPLEKCSESYLSGFYPILFSTFRILKEGPPGIGWGKGVGKGQWRTKCQTPQTNNYDHMRSVSFETCSDGIKLIIYHKWWALTMDCIQKSHPHWENESLIIALTSYNLWHPTRISKLNLIHKYEKKIQFN
jgi:hypothetical protein